MSRTPSGNRRVVIVGGVAGGHTTTALLDSHGYQARNLDGGFRTWSAFEAARVSDPARPGAANTES